LAPRYPECRENRMTLRVWVPVENVGVIIGKGGATINTIRAATNTNIQCQQGAKNEGGSDPASLWSPVTVVGPPGGCQVACGMILERVDEIDEIVAEFMIERTKHSTVIGPKGGTIRKLSADTGVRIHVPKAVARDRSEPKLGDGKLDRLITLEGGPPSVFKCFQAVMEICQTKTAQLKAEEANWRQAAKEAKAKAEGKAKAEAEAKAEGEALGQGEAEAGAEGKGEAAGAALVWNASGEAAAARAPWFVRSLVRRKSEAWARARGLDVVDELAVLACKAQRLGKQVEGFDVPGGQGGGHDGAEPVAVVVGRRGFLEQFGLLFRRSWREVARGRLPLAIKVVQQVSTALIYGAIYNLDDSQVSIQERFGLLSLVTIGAANLGVATTIRSFPKEKQIVRSDRAKKAYDVAPYFLAKLVAEVNP